MTKCRTDRYMKFVTLEAKRTMLSLIECFWKMKFLKFWKFFEILKIFWNFEIFETFETLEIFDKESWGTLVYAKSWITKGLRLDGAAIPKISKRHFFQDIWFSCQWVTGMGLKPRQNFFCKNISKIVGARPHQNFGLLKGVAAVSVVSWSKFFAQFIQGMWLTTGENFSQISQRVFELWLILF